VLIKTANYPAVQRAVAGGTPKVKPMPGGYEMVQGKNGKCFTFKGAGFVAVGDDEPMVAAVARPKKTLALTPELQRQLYTGDISFYVDLGVIQSRYSEQIKSAQETLLEALDTGGSPGMKETVKSAFARITDALKSGQNLVLSFD